MIYYFNKGNPKNYLLIIILARVLQLYTYVPSNLLKDQSPVVRLENVGWLVVFIPWKFSRIGGGEVIDFKKMPQYTRVEDL